MQPFAYAEPLPVSRPQECFFYHKLDLPGFGTVGGDWDLRDCASAYLGNYDFSGKRVLDVGAASGFLTFEMERCGAEVVSFDLNDGANWDIVPHYLVGAELAAIKAKQSATLVKLKKAYWLSHQALKSRARAFYGDVYNIDDRLGMFDVVYYGMIVSHLRDPVKALIEGAKLCRGAMIVTSIFTRSNRPTMTLIPRRDNAENLYIKVWWAMSIGFIREILSVLGFETISVVKSRPLITAKGVTAGRRECQTIVARRIA